MPLLRQGRVDFQGQYYQARECELLPRGPATRAGCRSSSGPRGRGCCAWWPATPTASTPTTRLGRHRSSSGSAGLEAACRDVGRDPGTIGRMAATRVALAGPGSASGFQVGPAQDGIAQFDFAGVRFPARLGSVEEVAAHLRAFEAIGIEHLTVNVVDPPGVRGHRALRGRDRGRSADSRIPSRPERTRGPRSSTKLTRHRSGTWNRQASPAGSPGRPAVPAQDPPARLLHGEARGRRLTGGRLTRRWSSPRTSARAFAGRVIGRAELYVPVWRVTSTAGFATSSPSRRTCASLGLEPPALMSSGWCRSRRGLPCRPGGRLRRLCLDPIDPDRRRTGGAGRQVVVLGTPPVDPLVDEVVVDDVVRRLSAGQKLPGRLSM